MAKGPDNVTAIAANIDKVITLMKALTFKRLAYLGMFLGITIGGYTVFENRTNIYKQTIGRVDATVVQQPLLLSEQSKQDLTVFVLNNKDVELVQVVEIDPYANQRRAVYWAGETGVVADTVNKGPTGKGTPDRLGVSLPLFSSDVDQNAQMIAILNGEFRCSAGNKGGVIMMYPSLKDKLITSCRVPLPPNGMNRLRGYIAIHLNRELSQYEMDSLRLQAVQISLKIFMSDIMKDPTAFDRGRT